MKLITKDTDYALKALCYIAKSSKEIISVKELVKCLDVPNPFLRKVLQVLNRHKLLRSYKGKGGGNPKSAQVVLEKMPESLLSEIEQFLIKLD